MFVINPLLFLLASLIGVAHGYAAPGAYKRLVAIMSPKLKSLPTNSGITGLCSTMPIWWMRK